MGQCCSRSPAGSTLRPRVESLPAIDFLRDTVEAGTHFTVAHRFSPYVRLHPQERYFPINSNDYIEQTAERTWANAIRNRAPHLNPDIEALANMQEKKQLSPTVHCAMRRICSDRPELRPFLDWLLIYYVFLYSDQPDAEACCGGPLCCSFRNTGHNADVEWTVSLVDPQDRLNAAFFSAHGSQESTWMKYSRFQMRSTSKPRVYVALGSHANFPDPGWKWRLWGANVDKCSSASQPRLNYGLRILEQSDPWFAYRGNMGKDGIGALGGDRLSLPSYKDASHGSQWFRRMFRCR